MTAQGAARAATATAARATALELTERELEVARLVAGGMRNKEIAAALSLSARTVESHVERIRRKLGFRSRAQIGRWITQRDVLDALERGRHP